MNEPLKIYTERYILLEAGMKELIARKGNSLCSQCSCICCDAVMCVEAMKSPFLKRIHQKANQYDPKKGFLSETGCILEKGRPSVCYEYFCDDHFYNQPDERHAEVLKIIGALLFHATRNAKGETALEDIATEAELEQLDFQSLEKQMTESLQAVEIIRAYYQDGKMSDDAYTALKQIQIAEEFQSKD